MASKSIDPATWSRPSRYGKLSSSLTPEMKRLKGWWIGRPFSSRIFGKPNSKTSSLPSPPVYPVRNNAPLDFESRYSGTGISNGAYFSFLNFLMIFGMKREKTNRQTEKKTLRESNCPQSPPTQTSFNVPMKKVKTNVPTIMPKAVPKK